MAEDKLFLILGDIIEIISPKNTELNNQIFFIEYIDETKMKLTNETSEITLDISDKKLTNKSIEAIKIISRADSPSYAIQHDLILDQWILITLTDGTLITGQIIDVQKDSIEVQVVDEENPIYIDFAYKGIPEDLPIESIEVIEETKKEDIYIEKGDEEEEVVVDGEEYEELEEEDWEQEEQPKKDLMKEIIETDHEVHF
jgi:PHD/YefM family antitoxin component YafN of YafNO toxin-antitoxin module